MPRKNGYKKRKYKRSYSKKTKKAYIPAKALYGAVDTALENRIVALAKAEVQKNIVRLVDRNYYFGTVNRDFNMFTGGRLLDYAGIVKQIGEVDKADFSSPINVPDVDPDEDQKNMELDADGAMQLMENTPHHGRRLTDMILIDGVTIKIRLFQEPMLGVLPSIENLQFQAWFQRNVDGSLLRQWPEEVLFKYRLVQLYFPEAQETGQSVIDKPSIDELLPMSTWGYTSKLDNLEYNLPKWTKKRILMDGSFQYKIGSTNIDKTITKHVSFSKPLLQKFLPADQNGQQATTWKLYLCLRCNIPSHGQGQPINYAPFKPRIHMVVKTHYHE